MNKIEYRWVASRSNKYFPKSNWFYGEDNFIYKIANGEIEIRVVPKKSFCDDTVPAEATETKNRYITAFEEGKTVQYADDFKWKTVGSLSELSILINSVTIRKFRILEEDDKYRKAFREGKRVQYVNIGNGWSDVETEGHFNTLYRYNNNEDLQFRILIKKTVPLSYEDDVLVGAKVKNKNHKLKSVITDVSDSSVFVGPNELTFEKLADDWTFLNGKPCTKVIEVVDE